MSVMRNLKGTVCWVRVVTSATVADCSGYSSNVYSVTDLMTERVYE